nr:unnamed protein product [Digitaria exilis]
MQATGEWKGKGVISSLYWLCTLHRHPLHRSFACAAPPQNHQPPRPSSHGDGARAFHLAVVVLALVPFLAQATAAENLRVRCCSLTTTTPLPPHCSEFPLGVGAPPTAAGTPAFVDHLRAPSPSAALPDAAAAPSPSTTYSDDSSPRSLGASAAAARPAPRCPSSRDLNTRATIVEAAPRSGATTPATKAVLLRALPLLAIPFLPWPVAALAAFSLLPTTVRARSDDCYKLNHATCKMYPYDNETDSVDRARPNKDMGLGAVCLHPLCHADSPERLASVVYGQYCCGRSGDIPHIYCTVRTLEGAPSESGGIETNEPSIFPWRNTWRVHLPIADPAAAAASGGDICYVELAHLDYREGYYIHCPVGEYHETYCTEFPEEAIAAAVWEHRRLNYRDTVGSLYATYQSKYKDEL